MKLIKRPLKTNTACNNTMLPACDASCVDSSFFLFYEGMVRARSDQKDLTNKSEIKFGSMHNVFTFALQIKTNTMKTYTKQPTIITNSLGVTSAIYANCEEIITWKITCFNNQKDLKC